MSKFAVVIHAEPAGGYWGEVPALPGCYSQGETVDELLANLREAIAGVLKEKRAENYIVQGAGAAFRAVTSISIFMRGSVSPAAIIVAAGRTSPKYLRSTGQHGSKSSTLGKM